MLIKVINLKVGKKLIKVSQLFIYILKQILLLKFFNKKLII